MVHAIETRYRGHRFRSRLEARWAVFFDAAGIEWEYEKEGFVTDNGPYLPDFWLPRMKFFVEVKGVPLDEVDFSRPSQIGYHHKPIAVFSGLPDAWGKLFCLDIADSGGGWSTWECRWAGTVDDRVLLWVPDAMSRGEPRALCHPDWTPIDGVVAGRNPSWLDVEQETFLNAVARAKEARFEHGETPR